jgi:hypothetical protein
MAGTFIKDPQERLDYGVDWTAELAGDGIVDSSWTVAAPAAGAGTPVVAEAPSIDGKITRIWLSGGVAGVVYDVTNHIATVQTREFERTLKIAVRQK